MTTTQAAIDALFILGDNCTLPLDQRQELAKIIATALTRLSELEKAAEGMEGALAQIIEACETGNIDSPEIGEHGHKWHEEWLHYSSERLAAYRKIKGEVK